MSIEIFGSSNCRWCDKAKLLCSREKLTFVYRDISLPINRVDFDKRCRGAKTVPQIFVAGHHVGGYSDFESAVRIGLIQRLIGEEK